MAADTPGITSQVKHQAQDASPAEAKSHHLGEALHAPGTTALSFA